MQSRWASLRSAELRPRQVLLDDCRLGGELGYRPCARQGVQAIPGLVLEILERLPEHTPLVILALDGINDSSARAAWRSARVQTLTSTFPTTSVCAWMSSATGLAPAVHGVTGVVYADEPGETLFHAFLDRRTAPGNAWRDADAGLWPPARACIATRPTFFDAMRERGRPVSALLGDLASWPGQWRDAIVRGADPHLADRDWATLRHAPHSATEAMVEDVDQMLSRGSRVPSVWAFLNFDDHIHANGYDAEVASALESLETACLRWSERGCAVVAYSDHGLTPVDHDPVLISAWQSVGTQRLCRLPPGGAGRTRWLHPHPGCEHRLLDETRDALADAALVLGSEQLDSLGLTLGAAGAHSFGSVVAIARSPRFPVPDAGVAFDHGALTEAEIFVPFATWGPDG